MSDLILYNYFRSSTSFRVRIALELKKLPYKYQAIHLVNDGGEQNKPAYRQLNPMGGVPTLKHGDHTISQSFAIIEYLDEAFPQSYQLLPKDPYTRAKIRQFCENINADIHAYGNLKTLQYLQKNYQITEEQKNTWVQDWFSSGMKACEQMLESSAGEFCFGHQITAADVFLVPLVTTAERFHVKLNHFKKILEVNSNCQKNEAFIKAHPFRQPDTPPELKI